MDPHHVRCLYCGRARNAFGACSGCGAEAPVVACVGCRRPVASPLDRCSACGTACLAWADAAAHELRCPRCAGRLERVELEGVHVEQCARCNGCFIRTEDFGELVSRDEAGQVEPRRFAPPPGHELPRQTLLALVRCPHCPREMDRARFAQRAALVIDVCPAHGIWLDAGELAGILDFVKQRTSGQVALDAAERAERDHWERIESIRATEQVLVDMHATRAEQASQRPSAAGVVVATAVAGPWAGLFVAMRGLHKR